MAVQHRAHDEYISFDEYLTIIKKDPEHGYEYLDGRIYMMTGGSPDHSIIGSNVNGILRELLKGRRCIVYNSDVYVQLAEDFRVCPDVTVSCDPRDRGAKSAIHYPSVIVEVLSPTTEARDRGEKALRYRSSETIQEYLIVNANTLIIELFRREKQGFWTVHTLEQNDTVELTSLEVRFSVTDIYRDTSLLEEPSA
jgi:Uma2 family endonuclease